MTIVSPACLSFFDNTLKSSFTGENSHGHICPGNIFAGDIVTTPMATQHDKTLTLMTLQLGWT